MRRYACSVDHEFTAHGATIHVPTHDCQTCCPCHEYRLFDGSRGMAASVVVGRRLDFHIARTEIAVAVASAAERHTAGVAPAPAPAAVELADLAVNAESGTSQVVSVVVVGFEEAVAVGYGKRAAVVVAGMFAGPLPAVVLAG